MQLRRSKGAVACTLLLGLVAAAKLCLSPAQVEQRDPALQVRGAVLVYQERPFSGVLVERYENGALYRKTQFRSGVRDGASREFALNGRVRSVSRYVHGVRDGLQLGWYVEGPKRYEYHYRNGLLEGTQTEWHQSGAIFRQANYSAGVETDKKIFFPNGHAFTNYAKRDGRLYGLDGGSLCMEIKKEGEK